MMQSKYLSAALASSLALAVLPAHAKFSIGDSASKYGALTVSGYVRAKYQIKDYSQPADDQSIEFDAAQLKLDYAKNNFFAHADYRCYQYSELCDFSTLVDAYAGYHLNDQSKLVLGIQPVAFGPGQYWNSSLYGSINTTTGLEDVHNLGANYQLKLPTATTVDVGYFIADGGHYQGSSQDAARYSSNYVHSSDANQSEIEEKDMWIARVAQDLNLGITGLSTQVGASYWHSKIDNKSTSSQGKREAWSVFSKLNYGNLGLSLTGGKNSVSNQDSLHPDYSLMGSFDSEYAVANDAKFYTVDLSYVFKNVEHIGNITPYVMYSNYDKQQAGAKDSQRNIFGVAIDHKQLSLLAEYIVSKNDPFVGGSQNALAMGDDGKSNKLFNLTLFYYF